ncbi:hypothetical protein POTOM_030239 [Populus tomentosa]|uniref:Uncharacterized protein n=1 Tax=Populus tomentosa TaxID=118781 RepID=A0A8X7ZCH0_POPTO|nr:hypothetical protein POTOM_030239 [Populus tomentosa]
MERGGCNEASEVRKSFVDVAEAGWRRLWDRWLPNKICTLPSVSSGLISPVCRLLVHNQSNIPPEIPGKNPPEFLRRSNNNEYPPSVPPEVPELPSSPEIETSPPDEGYIRPPRIPEVPNPGPDFPVPPLPTPPDVPLPPPGTPWPPPPDRLPHKLPPDIIPPPAPPPPDIDPPLDAPDIKPPPGPYLV